MRFLFLNQYGPPEPVPTARLLGELADALRADGHAVEVVSQTQSYQGRPARGGGRLKRELRAAWTILRAGWKPADSKPDVVLALSSPPGLLVVGALLAWRHRARLAHWAMDLYPELALALGEVRPGSFAARAVNTAMRWGYRRAALVIALDEDMRAHLQPLCRCQVRVLEPWPSVTALAAGNLSEAREHATPWTWLYSGNLGRAHEWQTLLDAQRFLEDRGLPVRLIFQGDGAARAAAQSYAKQLGLRACEWTGYVSESDLVPALLAAQVLIVTQRPETRGLLWPSKLALLARLPRPILYVGPENGAIAERLRSRGNAGVFSPGQAVAVADWIEELYPRPNIDSSIVKNGLPATPTLGPALLQSWLEELAL